MNFLYPIGFTLGCELVILVCKSYLLFFLPPHFSSIKLALEQVFLVDLSKLSLRFLNTLFIYCCEVNGLLCVQKIFWWRLWNVQTSFGRWLWVFLCSSTKFRCFYKGEIHCCSHRIIRSQYIISWWEKSTCWFSWVDKCLITNNKLDVDFGPSMEIKAPCPEVIQSSPSLTRIKPQQLCKDGNWELMDEYVDLFLTLVSCDVC